MLISIMGVDGSGKTTLAKALSKSIKKSKYKYAGYNIEQRKFIFMHNFIVKERHNIFEKVLKKLLIIINDYIEFNYKAQKDINIYDRYIYDLPIQNRRKIRKYFYEFLIFFYKKPDLLIFLTGDADSIYNRKKELSPMEIDEMIKEYKKLFNKFNINYYELDSVKLNQDELVFKVKEYYESIR